MYWSFFKLKTCKQSLHAIHNFSTSKLCLFFSLLFSVNLWTFDLRPVLSTSCDQHTTESMGVWVSMVAMEICRLVSPGQSCLALHKLHVRIVVCILLVHERVILIGAINWCSVVLSAHTIKNGLESLVYFSFFFRCFCVEN